VDQVEEARTAAVAAAAAAEAALRDEETCGVCQTRQHCTVLLPCRHANLCAECMAKVPRCIECRALAHHNLKWFIPPKLPVGGM
jgi:hypothetical protein